VALSDLAVLAVVVTAVVVALRGGAGRLRAGLPLWVAALAFVLYAVVRARTGTHLVAALKFAEYAALAPAVPLLARRRSDLGLLAWALVAWSAVASFVGLLQLFGVDILDSWGAGSRQPSFLGQLDFASLSGMAFVLALAGLAFGTQQVGGRRLVAAAAVSGIVGLVLSASVAGLAGAAAATACAVALGVHRGMLPVRRLLALGATLGIVALGVVGMRGGDIVQFTRFLGIAEKQESTSADVQTYAQRTVLVYIGWRIFLDNPVVGAGFHASNDPAVFEPELPAAKARYPDAAPLSFPSRENPWGVQNAYVQALADLGAVGLVLLLAALAAALATAVRLAYRGAAPAIALVAGGWVLVAAGVWSALGLVSGVPADATLWLGVGLAGAAILVDREAREGRADAAA
jgi:O-antigen ligase